MAFELFIAKRYLRSKRTTQFVSIINMISVVGVAVGVAALLIVLSVFNGFTGVVESVLVSFDPHLKIEKQEGIATEEMDSLEGLLASEEEIVGFSPFVTGKAMIVSRSFGKVVYVKGVDDRRIAAASGLAQRMVLGSLTLQDSGSAGSIVLGLTLADRLGVVVGGEVAIVSPYAMSSALTPFSHVAPTNFRVTGIFDSNNKDYDANYAYVSIPKGREMFRTGDTYSGVELRLNSIDASQEVQSRLLARLGDGFHVSTWYDLHEDLYSVMRIERWIAYILLCLIILVASFNMLGSLSMSVIEKRRDIGILRSMGATMGGIIRVFMTQGLFVGALGTGIGIVLGLVLLYIQVEYHLVPLDPTIYIIPAIPVEIHLGDFVSVSASSLLLSFVASYFPARRAAKLVPVEAIRWE